MKNRITRKTLRRAGFLEREARLSALPEAPAHDFSPAFAQAAAPTLAKGRRSALAQDFTRRTAAAMLALMLALTAAVAAIPQARAAPAIAPAIFDPFMIYLLRVFTVLLYP